MYHPLALVIGAGPGIGLAVARRFAREGFEVGLVTQHDAGLGDFKAAVASSGAPAVQAFAADLRDACALEKALRQLQDAGMGAPQVLVYNASLGHAATPSQLDPEALAEAFRVNVLAALESVRSVLTPMRKSGRGTLLFTGGGLALAPKAREASLSIGKAGLRSLALCLAEELEPEGIHVATLTIQGFVQPNTPFGPDTIAEHFWELHREPQGAWRREVVVRP